MVTLGQYLPPVKVMPLMFHLGGSWAGGVHGGGGGAGSQPLPPPHSQRGPLAAQPLRPRPAQAGGVPELHSAQGLRPAVPLPFR